MAKKRKHDIMKDHLNSGEIFIWEGQPEPGKEYRKIDWFLLPLSAVMLAVSTFYAMMLIYSVMFFGFSLHHFASFILLLIVGGLSLYMYFLRFSAKRTTKKDLRYGVTNVGRVFICDDNIEQVYIYNRSELDSMTISDLDKQGYGTVYLLKKGFFNAFDNTGLDFISGDDGMHMALFDVKDAKKIVKRIKGKKI